MSLLEAQGIEVRRGERTILSKIDVSLSRSQFLVVAGPNGSGKSTLLRALTGIWPVARGEVLLFGKPLRQYTRREIAQAVGYVPQDTKTDFGFTVREIVAMGRHPHRGRFSTQSLEDRIAIDRAITVCDLAELLHRPVGTLSGGERQRVAIARSLAVEPKTLLLDEPTASLDVEHALGIFTLCQQLAESGCAVALCTHDLNAALRFSHSLVLMRNGVVFRQGKTSDVIDNPAIESVFGVRAELLRSSSGEAQLLFHAR